MRAERAQREFVPQTVTVCDLCQSDGECPGGRCVSGLNGEGVSQQACTTQTECNGRWSIQGHRAFCIPNPRPGDPLPP